MARKLPNLVAIEIGSNALKVFMGEPQANGTITILGHVETSTVGKVMKGEVVNVDAVTGLLTDALNSLEDQTGEPIETVYAAVTGSHIASQNYQGSLPITTPDRTIREEDVVEATRNARAFSLPVGRTPIHSLGRTYLVDGHRRSSNPIGMIANQLTADVHVIHGNYNHVQTLCKLIDDVIGFPANDVAFSGIADFYGLAISADRNSGTLLIDIGAGSTEYVLFYENGCVHSGQIAVGCEHLANDLSIALNLPITRCRDLMRRHGSARRRADVEHQRLEVETSIGHPTVEVRMATLHTVMELRLQELFEIIRQDLANQNVLNMVGENVILCGGGSLITDIRELAQEIFAVPIAIGLPGRVNALPAELNSPRYVTPIGLLHLGCQLQQMDPSVPPALEVMKREVRQIFGVFRRAIRL